MERTKKVLNSKITSKKDKKSLKAYFWKIKSIFFTYGKNTVMERLKSLLDGFDEIPKALKLFTTDKIISD
ncbi:hypothetical protein [Methanobacterium ferruginis]|uniref:hypothetical protein n=1 Tax=Methanobacterium ferruginis TaxID=710191 RepID=UPI00257353A6|nr:hypothetical protein [Methanobacterium ferruginis]BDZ68084.1 hypothetical protein GCM10025860_15320 [Methanobacterium ferruginis]